MVMKSQVLTNCVVSIVDLLAATAGLQVDFDADVINRHSMLAKTNDLGIAGVLLIEVSQKLDLQFFFRWWRAEFVQNLILYGRM